MSEQNPRAVIFDIDGTLALRGEYKGVRGWFEWHRVGEDSPNSAVVELAQALHAAGSHRIIVMSGRDEVCRRQTELWLDAQGVPFDELHMRAAGDNRADAIVKAELFRHEVQPRFDIAFVVDDRQSVVDMWRSEFKLVCMQVAPGNF